VALPPFAAVSDLAALMQTDVNEAAAGVALASASALIRGWTRQTISRVVDDVVTLRAPEGYERALVLPQRPVQSVSRVEINGLQLVDWVLSNDRLLRYCGWRYLPGRMPYLDPGLVTVTYTHGWAEIPDDVRAVCLDLASMTITNPSGLRTVQIDDYSRTFAAETLGSGTLSDAHKEILAGYRRRVGTMGLR
jgi:hypothetical protein